MECLVKSWVSSVNKKIGEETAEGMTKERACFSIFYGKYFSTYWKHSMKKTNEVWNVWDIVNILKKILSLEKCIFGGKVSDVK